MSNSELENSLSEIESLEEQRADCTREITAVINDLAEKGYDKKGIRAILKRRKMEAAARAEWDSMIAELEAELYG